MFFVLAAVLAVLLLSPDLLFSRTSMKYSQSTIVSGSAIALENAHLGTESWKIPIGREASTQIQAYANATSVQPGQKLSFYVSTQKERTPYSVDIYRLGWYEGYGGRLMASWRDQIGHAQGYYDTVNHRLVGCNSCYVDRQGGLVEANWQPSFILTIPSDWITGVYLAKFTGGDAMQTYVPFDVKGNLFSRYIAVTPDTTSAAYNKWGGYSLYEEDGSTQIDSLEKSTPNRAVKVSFDRPYLQAQGSGLVLAFEANAIHWLERQGYDLSYVSSTDLHENPSLLLHHRAYLSLGHDEYWTKEMRDGVENARNHGVGLAFLGANDAYWQIRFESDSAGTPDRTIVCYKVESANKDLARDPFYRKDITRLTSLWRDPIIGRPENALIDIMYSGLASPKRQGFPWEVNSEAKSPFLNGTGLLPGQRYGCDLVGYEWDRVFTNNATPAGLQVLSMSPTVKDDNTSDISNTTYYIAPSGAMVFATGSTYWSLALDNYRYQTDNACAYQSTEVPGIQQLMAHVMDALATPQSTQK